MNSEKGNEISSITFLSRIEYYFRVAFSPQKLYTMKTLLFCFLPAIFMIPGNKQTTYAGNPATSTHNSPVNYREVVTLNFQDNQEPGKMRSIVFKSQEYCRAELPDFEFNVQFKVVSATVYFSGTNFRGVEKGSITSNRLKPIKDLMDRCAPGSMVVFDDVKVMGPDKMLRTIPGLSLLLY